MLGNRPVCIAHQKHLFILYIKHLELEADHVGSLIAEVSAWSFYIHFSYMLHCMMLGYRAASPQCDRLIHFVESQRGLTEQLL